MSRFQKRHGLLPLTISLIAVLLAIKIAGLGSLALSARAASSEAAPAVVAKASAPEASPSKSEDKKPIDNQAPAPDAALLQELRERRQTLDARERDLDQRRDLVQAAEERLQVKLTQLSMMQHKLEQLDDVRQQRQDAGWTGLVKMYEDMKPNDAAPIFNLLDVDIMLEVLDRMNERKASSLLAAMLPERARLATQLLARKRMKQTTVQPATSVGVLVSDHS